MWECLYNFDSKKYLFPFKVQVCIPTQESGNENKGYLSIATVPPRTISQGL